GNIRNSASTGCPGAVTLSASATCVGATLQVTITAGDPNFNVIVNGITYYPGVPAGIYSVIGPVNFNNVIVEELSGNTESLNLGDFICHNPLTATSTCIGDAL
ncbi:MAG TPA: hypothetical protein PLZ51_28760, partial [Aggregatilineales bacterium]|nr:hypothetical protein [Aggregatilineales bacterium]